MAVPPFFVQVLLEHQDRLDRLTERRALPEIRKIYDQIGRELDRKIGTLVRAQRGNTMLAFQARQLQAQVRQAQFLLNRKLVGAMGDIGREAQIEAVRGIARDLARLERQFSGSEIVMPVEEVARFRGIIDPRRTSLLTLHRESVQRYGGVAIDKMENQIALSLATGENMGDTADRLLDVYDQQLWQAERIVRTETAWAFNATSHDALVDAAEEFGDLMMRWSEHVDDSTGEPYDDRVAVDSLAMHGQLARPGAVFTMPARAPRADADGRIDVPDALVGRSWEFPPCRPNGREVLAPWRPHWGIPGWVYRGGRRIPYTGRARG